VGIADMICAGIAAERSLSLPEARKLMWMCDSRGLVTRQRGGEIEAHKQSYARDEAPQADLAEVVRSVRPTVLIGTSGHARTFTQEIIETMYRHCDRPVIFALSNPTSKAECTAEEAYGWTEGQAIFASGSPFQPVRIGGRILVPGQGNNMYIFPGVGLGAVVCGAREITDQMFFAAARTLADRVTDEELHAGTIYPDLGMIRQISMAIAAAVCRVAWDQGLARYPEPDDIRQYVRDCMYHPEYRPYLPAAD
jgi:malate dehydrogenase (oxaloacetate-decarboxylating)(NADP+)